jgi:hypothetical protein
MIPGGGDIFFEGDLRPGNSTAQVQFGNNVGFGSGAILEIELAGMTPGAQYDQLQITGTVHLAGTLNLLPESPYSDPAQPGTVDIFEILLAAIREGTVDEVTYAETPLDATFMSTNGFRTHVGAGLFRVVKYDPNGATFMNYRALPGDANGDFVVDGSDFIIWNAHKFTTGTEWLTGDFTEGGITDGSDFIAWNTHKFTSVGTMLPEPGTLPLLVGIGMLFFCRSSANLSGERPAVGQYALAILGHIHRRLCHMICISRRSVGSTLWVFSALRSDLSYWVGRSISRR